MEVLEFTVDEINKILQDLIHDMFYFIRVRGEISNLSQPKSGHIYFTLKDKNSVLFGVCWQGTKLQFQPEDGMEVVCTGYLTTYQSKYQIVIEKIELIGSGALQAMLEERRKRLEKEGLFKNKRPLPFLPKIIGVVTSPTGAAINDIISRAKERFPIHILISPAAMQGSNSAQEVADAIMSLNERQVDLIIIARGGGSIEDLWAFNEELVVRAVANSRIPTISAIGHEIDFTLADYAADVRAPTPTAAIEMAIPKKEEVLYKLDNAMSKINNFMKYLLQENAYSLAQLLNQLIKQEVKIEGIKSKLLTYKNTLDLQIKNILSRKEAELMNLSVKLQKYDQVRLLSIGYVTACDKNGNYISSAKLVKKGDCITIKWADGAHIAVIAD